MKIFWRRFLSGFYMGVMISSLLFAFIGFGLFLDNPAGLVADVSMANNTIIPFNPSLYPGADAGLIEGSGSQGVVATVRNVYNQAKALLGPVLVFIVAGFGIQLIIAGGNEENFAKAGRHFFYVLVGVAFVVLADFLSQTFFLYQGGRTFVDSNQQIEATARALTQQIELVIILIRYILGGIALFYTVRSGAAILFNPNDETTDKQKEIFMYGFVGLILIMISEALVGVVFGLNTLPNLPLGQSFVFTSVNVTGGISLLGNLTNLLLAMLGGLFLFTLVAGGVLYAASAGNEERGQRATKIIIGSLLGLVIAFSSYTIVAEFSSGGREINEAPGGVVPLTAPSN